MNSSRTLPLLLAALLWAAPVEAQSAAEVQTKMSKAYQALVEGTELIKVKATYAKGKALHQQSIELYTEVLADLTTVAMPEDSKKQSAQIAHYNIACAHSLTGTPDAAFAALEEAIKAGWADLDHMNKDPDLAPIRKLERWKTTIGSLTSAREREAMDKAMATLKRGKLFDYAFRITTLDGTPLELADLKGKVVLIHYWGTWIPACREQVPDLVRLQQRFKDDLAIVGMTWERGLEGPEVVEQVRAFAAEAKIDYPLALISDPAELRRVPNLEGLPTLLLLDKTGSVRVKESGYRPYTTLEALVKALIVEKTPPVPARKKRQDDDWF